MKIDVLKGFSLGAVDYLKKPIDEEELVVRLNSLLERLTVGGGQTKTKVTGEVGIGDYVFSIVLHELKYIDGKIQKLTQRESDVLSLLVQHKNELCSHKQILNSLWGKSDLFSKKSLNVFISHLRKCFSKDPSIKIENLHNQGFVLRTRD